MIVVVSGLSGLTNAYRSVPSTWGSAATSGASRWLDAVPATGPRVVITPAPSAAVATMATAALRNRLGSRRNESTSLLVFDRTEGMDRIGRRPARARTLRARGSPVTSLSHG